jgi:hypothetical protein
MRGRACAMPVGQRFERTASIHNEMNSGVSQLLHRHQPHDAVVVDILIVHVSSKFHEIGQAGNSIQARSVFLQCGLPHGEQPRHHAVDQRLDLAQLGQALPQNACVPLDRVNVPPDWRPSVSRLFITPAPAPNSGAAAPRSGIVPSTGSFVRRPRGVFLVPGSDGQMIAPGGREAQENAGQAPPKRPGQLVDTARRAASRRTAAAAVQDVARRPQHDRPRDTRGGAQGREIDPLSQEW